MDIVGWLGVIKGMDEMSAFQSKSFLIENTKVSL